MSNFIKKLFGKKNNQEIEENNNSLQELDDDMKHTYRYLLQYRFIPTLVKMVNNGDIPPEVLLGTENWDDVLKRSHEGFFFDWDEFKCKGFKVNNEYELALYLFPQPLQVPEAACAAVLINTTTNEATYYTLEMSFDDSWVLGSMNDGTHRNYGYLENPSVKSFLDWVIERIEKSTK